jgi:2-dehydropantoate 2-reductase
VHVRRGPARARRGSLYCLGEIALGDPDGGPSETADRVGTALGRSRLPTTVAADMPRRLWRKLAVNAGINPTTALAGVKNGAARGGDLGSLASEAARETAMVARREGIELHDAAATGALDRVASTTAENTSSMRQDIEAGRRTEIDSLNGHVVDRADEHGLRVPINRTLAGLVRAWEAERGFR